MVAVNLSSYTAKPGRLPIVTVDPGPRRIKQSLRTGSSDQVNDLLVEDGQEHYSH